MLPPGVRYCVCYGDQHREHVGVVSIQGGQLLWSVPVHGRPRGWYSYVAVVRQGNNITPVELQDEATVRETVENGRALYLVRGPRDQRYEIEAAALVEAALEGREIVDAVPSTAH
jgi:hypothetical protein